MDVEWLASIRSKIFSRIVNEFSKKMKENYGMTDVDNFSTDLSKYTKAHFPFVLVKMLPALERGQDLEGDTINAGLFTFQVDVTDNKSQKRAEKVAYEILRIMKAMRFEVMSMPSFEDTTDTHRSTARYSRVIGSGDAI